MSAAGPSANDSDSPLLAGAERGRPTRASAAPRMVPHQAMDTLPDCTLRFLRVASLPEGSLAFQLYLLLSASRKALPEFDVDGITKGRTGL